MSENDWFDDRADRFFEDKEGCPQDRWTNKADCPHCVAELLREASKIGESVMREGALEVVDDIFGADSPYYQQIKSRLEEL